MKKQLFILAAAALALVSCSNDETIAVNEGIAEANTISFRALNSGITRAADITTTSLGSFYVTANIAGSPTTNYFGGATAETFTDENIGTGDGKHASTAGTYTSATKHYWPSMGKLDFIAYAPATGTGITRTDSTHFSITPNATPSAQQDFLYAVVRDQDKATNGAGVVLNFRHAESKVVIQLKNSSTDLKFTVKDVAINYIKPTGAFAPVYKTTDGSQSGFCTNGSAKSNTTIASETGYYITGAAWTASGTETSYSQTAGTTAYAAGATTAVSLTDDMILIPQALTTDNKYYHTGSAEAGNPFHGAYISVELKIQDAQDHYIIGTAESYVTAIWPLAAITWLPGHRYTYTVDLAGGGYYPTNQDTNEDLDPILENAEIQFINATIDEWIDYDYDGSTDGNQPIPVPVPEP